MGSTTKPDVDEVEYEGRVEPAEIWGDGALRSGPGPLDEPTATEVGPVDVGDNGGKGGRWDRVEDTCLVSSKCRLVPKTYQFVIVCASI